MHKSYRGAAVAVLLAAAVAACSSSTSTTLPTLGSSDQSGPAKKAPNDLVGPSPTPSTIVTVSNPPYTAPPWTPAPPCQIGCGTSPPIIVTPKPTPTPDPQACAYTGNATLDAAIRKDSKLRSLLVAEHNLGMAPTISATSLPQWTAANTNQPYGSGTIPSNQTPTIDVDLAQVTLSGQPLNEVIAHEALHFFFGGYSHGTSTSMSVGGITFTYDLTTAAGFDAYDHLLVNDGLDTMYGSDATGAIYQALGMVPDGKGDGGWMFNPAGGVTATKNGQPATAADSMTDATANGSAGTGYPEPILPPLNLANELAQNGQKCNLPGYSFNISRRTITGNPVNGSPVPRAAATPYNGTYWSGDEYSN